MFETLRLNINIYSCNLHVNNSLHKCIYHVNPQSSTCIYKQLNSINSLCLVFAATIFDFFVFYLFLLWWWRLMGTCVAVRERVMTVCVCLRRTCVFLTGAGIGAIQSIPITGTFPAYWSPFVQERRSVAPAAQTRLRTEREREIGREHYCIRFTEQCKICSISVLPFYLEAVFKLLTDKVEGNWVDAGV